jgi:inositol hexakisphosphate/diphosphoinositol-pentakisphosphate kinase
VRPFFDCRSAKDCKKDLKVKEKAPMIAFLKVIRTTLAEWPEDSETEDLRHQLMHIRDILERWKIVGLNRKIQIKPKKFEEYEDEDGETRTRCTEVQLIMKWCVFCFTVAFAWLFAI